MGNRKSIYRRAIEKGRSVYDPTFMARYFVEHRYLPDILFDKECTENFINALIENGKKEIISIYKKEFYSFEMDCPFTERQFVVQRYTMNNTDYMIDIKLPPPDQKHICSRVIIATNADFSNVRYFTIEFDHSENNSVYQRLYEWKPDGTHFFQQTVFDTQKDQLDAVMDIFYYN